MQRAALTCCLLFILLSSITFAKILIDQELLLPKDNDNFIRVFHGVNVVYKPKPYLPPQREGFHFNLSFSKEDAALLKKWGMNIIRLGVLWEGFEPVQGKLSEDYYNEMKRIISICQEYNIYVLIDMHQDVANRKYCGEGMPDWAVETILKFPLPLPYIMHHDEEGYPVIEDCVSRDFGKYYLSDGVLLAFQDLYDNKRQTQDHFTNVWREIAKTAKDYPNLFGYELFNEPYVGHVIRHPDYIFTGEEHNLLPFYTNIINKIKEVDKENLILFEVTGSPAHMSKIPGAAEDKSRIMFSYHIYCDDFDPADAKHCIEQFNKKDNEYIHLKSKWGGISSFLTEFGAIPGHEGANIEMINHLLDLTASKFNSWAYWQYKFYDNYTTAAVPRESEGFWDGKGNLIEPKVKLLSRPYAYKICGKPISTSYNQGRFEFEFEIGRKCAKQITSFYIDSQYHFPSFTYNIVNCPLCKFTKVEESYYELDHTFAIPGRIKIIVIKS